MPAAAADPELVAQKGKDLEKIKEWQQAGLICLLYLDESGCYSQGLTGYAYEKRGKQKCIPQNRRRGRRVGIIGVYGKGELFDYALMVGTLKSPGFIKLMEWQAKKAEKRLEETGRVTIIVLDNASVHRAKIVRENWKRWREMGLIFFFLPPRSPQLNRIEDEWLHLKRDELAAQVFEDEYELSQAIIAGIEARATRGGCTTERFRFN